MQCPIENIDHAEVLMDYCARKLSGKALEQFERHLEICTACKSFCSGQHSLWNSLGAWEAEPVSEQFDSKLYARIEAFENRSWWKRLTDRGIFRQPAVSLAAACAALAIALLVRGPVHQPKVAAPIVHETTKVEALEPEQIERTLEDLEMLKQLSPSNAQNL